MEASSRMQRLVTTRLPTRWLYALCHAAIPLYYLYRIPLFYPLRLLTKIAMDPDPEWRVLDTFDWYSARYQWKHTYAEVRSWFEGAGDSESLFVAPPQRRQLGEPKGSEGGECAEKRQRACPAKPAQVEKIFKAVLRAPNARAQAPHDERRQHGAG